jgi:hypothetical protein
MVQYISKIIIVSCLFILISSIFIPQTLADPTVMVTDYHLEPETLLPGDKAELSITLTNTETTSTKTNTDYDNNLAIDQTVGSIAATLNNVWITSDGDGTYSIKATENYEDIGDLSPGSSISLSFEISAHENISSGLYTPVINVDVQDHQDVHFPIPVRISSISATLLPKDVPKKISSSGSTTITLSAVNNRETTIEDVTVSANTNQSISVSPTSTYIGTLESESSQDISLSLHPDSLGEQEVSFSLSYRNGENIHTETITIPIEVIETHDVSPVLYDIPDFFRQHNTERITLEVYNAKSDTITGVTVIPVTEFVTSPSEYFIGSMDSDDVFSASFNVNSGELEPGNYTLGFKVAFKQGNNYFESPIISNHVMVIENDTVTESFDAGFLIAIIGLIILIVIILFFVFRKRRIIK